MATIREIKKRIKTSKNISQVTRAMEMVSAVKMRKAQDMALVGRAYTEELEKMVTVLSREMQTQENSIFLTQRENVKKALLIVVAPKKGLCGPLIGNLNRQVVNFKNDKTYSEVDFSFIAVGKKSKDIIKVFTKTLLADFEITGVAPTITDAQPIADYALQRFVTGEVDTVLIAYTQFVNTLSQKPVIKQLLPIPLKLVEEAKEELKMEVLFEPTIGDVLDKLVIRYSQAMVYQFLLEATASEHSARMVAMKSAHDSANDIISDLTLYYNQARQNSITTELADAVSSRLGQN